MNITYYGHSCFGVEVNGKHLLFDPFISSNELATNIDVNTVKADYIMVSHGHFLVNNKRVTIPSYGLKSGDVIKIREGSKVKKIFNNLAEKIKDYNPPEWLSFDIATMEGKIKGKPKNTEGFIDLNAVLEFYSR